MSHSKKSKPIKWIEDLTRTRQYRSNFLATALSIARVMGATIPVLCYKILSEYLQMLSTATLKNGSFLNMLHSFLQM